MGGIYLLFWWGSMVECEKRPVLVWIDGGCNRHDRQKGLSHGNSGYRPFLNPTPAKST
jgi:hypothetical protein